MSVIPPTSKRVYIHTSRCANRKIDVNTLKNLSKYKNADYKTLTKRLKELDREWDTERVLELNASAIILLSSLLGLYYNKKWLKLTCVVSYFLLQHAVQGWCPPLPLIRQAGVRTAEEINDEKNVIKIIRGDYKTV